MLKYRRSRIRSILLKTKKGNPVIKDLLNSNHLTEIKIASLFVLQERKKSDFSLHYHCK